MKTRQPIFLVAALVLLACQLTAAEDFGNLQPLRPEVAKTRAIAWLKQIGKFDAASQKQVDAIWRQTDRLVLDRVTETFALGSPEAGRLLAQARDAKAAAPTKVPALLVDPKQPVFFRANLALACGRALCMRRVYEEALDILQAVKAEDVVEPATYLFQRAVCEYALLLKADAQKTINRLVDEVRGPERYQIVAVLMLMDMQTWKEKDLGAVARKMGNIERRLELARGGPHTQKLQKEVIRRLDELIKELEKKNPPGDGPTPADPKPGKPGEQRRPADDFQPGGPSGPGTVDRAKLKKLRENWGNMPRREREQALQELTRGMLPRYREAIENFFRNLTDSPRKQ